MQSLPGQDARAGNGGAGGAGVGLGGGGGGGQGGHGIVAAFFLDLYNYLDTNISAGAGGAGGSAFLGHGGNGGDGGTTALVFTYGATVINDGVLQAGRGGDGGSSASGKGGTGGTGGFGINVRDTSTILNGISNTDPTKAIIRGGDGGNGGGSGTPGLAGVGGAGNPAILVEYENAEFHLTNAGQILGGNGGATGAGGRTDGAVASGAPAIQAFAGVATVIVNSGLIAGGLSGDGRQRADAIQLGASDVELFLEAGSDIRGNVVKVSGGNQRFALILSGGKDASFDTSTIGPTAQYRPFTEFRKEGDSRWTLNGSTSALTPWVIKAGALAISDDASLGDTAGGLALAGGTLAALGNVTLARAVHIAAAQGVLDVSDRATLQGVVDGPGALVKSGTGTLALTAANSYAGGTVVNAGTLKIDNTTGSATGSGAVQVNSGGTLGGGGTISGAVTVVDGGTLAAGNSPGTLNTGALSLSGGSILSYELGQAGTAGGPLNDLVNVTGNLTLDGTLNVAQSSGGTFGPGLYRLITYTGSLTDNGLDVGAVPSGTVASDLSVQTSVAKQINLVNRAGFSFNFWDGGNGADYNNGTANGGSGAWRVGAPGDGWTDMDGTLNASWKQDQFAMFGGKGGTVTVDKSGGRVSIGGAQFMVDGYVVQGDELNISGASTVVRVGDGTAGGARMTATINSAITGTGGLSKEDVGTLVLGGANTYTGGTTVKAGVLQGNTTSLQGDIVNDAKVTFDQAANGIYAGTMSGTGSLRKIGTGELQLAAANSYGGGTQVDAGTVDAAVAGALGTGPVFVAGGSGLVFSGSAGAGSLQITAGPVQQTNGGFIQFKDNASAGSATIVTQANGSIDFRDNTTAGNATIENRGGETTVWFNATAGKAHITNYAGGSTNFLDDGSAGQSALVNETGGVIDFFDRAKADQATVVNKAGGTVRISKLTTDAITIGALEGAGRVLLGAKALTTGGLNTDTEVSGVISGVGGSVVKVGTGALTLSGANTYSGGTVLHQGRLNVGHNEALGTGALSMDDDTTLGFSADGVTLANAIQLTGQNDPVIDTGAFNGALSGAISGGGFITKEGTGTLTLSGANTYTGATNVAQGTLKAGAANTLSASSAHGVASGATLDLAGFNQSVASLTNSGTVSLVGATPGTTLIVNGNYVGNNGVLKLSAALNSTGPSDRLVFNGVSAVASGKTSVQITNLGGLGALTSGNGIEVITAQNGATTTAQTTKDAFALAGGHVDAGAYEYRLNAADANGAGENWYLRSTTEAVSPGNPAGAPVITYRPEASLYAALPGQLRQGNLAMLGDLRKRVGDDDVKGTAAMPTGSDRRAWARVLSTDIDIQQGGTVSPTSKGRLTGFQAGTDLLATPNWRAGLYVGQLDGDATVNGFASGVNNLRTGRNDLRSQYVGVYGTYAGDSGFYADAVVQSGRHRYTVQPNLSGGVQGKGNSLLGSIEVGQAFALGGSGWSIEPQLQLIHQHMDLSNSAILGAVVQPEAGSGWIARAGVRVKGQIDTAMGVLQPYGRFNVYKISSGTDIARFVNGATRTDIAAPTGGTSTELAGGFTLALGQRTSLYGEVGKLWSSGGGAKVKGSINGSLGVQLKW
ncbi:autotransporter outer membrane beta-barrel domain-containing protein [Variovorax paradoxus]|uniref:autotransporter outer membrane beta-barrel domain-containing protein n=1 Tax=Variovorax paradoxus TaxID=34073 RepID=UPI002787B59D|nr:autotransporter outer membrane beta-barrel domain-containing protein [Variovorax paradoxus]MDQ0586279.1 fibronectin-binding autotransporter adhesin [Variovorax paradoxus]